MEQLIDYHHKAKEIHQLFVKTFSDSEGLEEGETIGELVLDFIHKTSPGDLRVYVEKHEGKIIACVFYTKFRFELSEIPALLLSPMAVHTSFQAKGIGQKLIRFAHEDLYKRGVQLIVSYGDINFYSKAGFQQISEEVIQAPLPLSMPHGWIAQSLNSHEIPKIQGKTYCVEAINNPNYW
jgi:predicted N-acetyltransferase YhbS